MGLAKSHASATSLYLNLQPGEANDEAHDPLQPWAAVQSLRGAAGDALLGFGKT